MSDILEFETYLSISPKKFEIYLFDIKNFKNPRMLDSRIINQMIIINN